MKLDFPATQRNREPILDVLRQVLPSEGLVLEIASGSGQHSVAFAQTFANLEWQPTDLEPSHLASIEAYVKDSGLKNLRAPLPLDVREAQWPIQQAQAVLNINMIHISPWSCCECLFTGAAKILEEQSLLYMYGPFKVEGKTTAPSNEAFDESLRSRNPEWGLRWLSEVADAAGREGFELERTVEMPANNLSVIFRLRR